MEVTWGRGGGILRAFLLSLSLLLYFSLAICFRNVPPVKSVFPVKVTGK